MINESDYQDACFNPYLRQNFLDKIKKAGVPEYVQRISYSKKPSLSLFDMSNAYMTTRPLLFSNTFPRFKSEIQVYENAFDTIFHKCLSDFMCTLEDHEFTHAKQFFFGMTVEKYFGIPFKILFNLGLFPDKKIAKKYLFDLQKKPEAEAYKNQLDNISRRNCSLQYALSVGFKYAKYSGISADVEVFVKNSFGELEKKIFVIDKQGDEQ
ncbi:MAG: hypothetical protein ABIC91_07520 [Nanoarchaeota archaeon]|nr:hypothetical protein [Nanoarchaeota archaeon]MBU1029760.1 hypothetical protein [Nanoarchaeota archaeon]MBU1850767.1 hypothetical protein [Nanoarchaeota archaeon]